MAQETMRAMAVDHFGGPENLTLHQLPVPQPGPKDVLIRVQFAGVGEWDPYEREGGFAEMLPRPPKFPYVLGSEGAGKVEACGREVQGLAVGDRVYAVAFPNARGGFYAEYAVINQALVAKVPSEQGMLEASVMAGVGITALRGLADVLQVSQDDSVAIVGASGGIGHLAVQLAKRMGGRVFAVASGADGVALAQRLGADAAIDGHLDGVLETARAFAEGGISKALLTTGGDVAERVLMAMREAGQVAYPSGVMPEPAPRANLKIVRYDGMPDADILERFEAMAKQEPFDVHVAHSFPLQEAPAAQEALKRHFLGKLALRVS
ncbi:MAG: NADP-dependent oxidoreductase [Myxococcales bacterium]